MTTTLGKSPQSAYSPSAFTQMLRKHFTQQWSAFWLSGEIFELYQSPAGHCYFTLKDQNAAVKCVLFRKGQSISLQKGQKVTVFAQISIYPNKGELQLNVLRVTAQGVGDWEQQLLLLKQKLQAEGLFSVVNKQTVPEWVENLAIVSSANGAALQDVLKVFYKNNPLVQLTVYSSIVQGPKAPGEIIEQLTIADGNKHDAILLTRGGGSKEDLWAFNDEFLARHIFKLQTPIITAIGHQTDESIADLVADLSCITPTAAAQLIAGDFLHKYKQLQHHCQLLHHFARNLLANRQQTLGLSQQRLLSQHPKNQLKLLREKLRQGQQALTHNGQQKLAKSKRGLLHTNVRLERQKPRFEQLKARLAQQKNAIDRQIEQRLSHSKHQFEQRVNRLGSHNPLHILAQGYSVTQDAQQRPITDSKQLKIGQEVETLLKFGKIRSKITEQLD